jgi:hypothetical protein
MQALAYNYIIKPEGWIRIRSVPSKQFNARGHSSIHNPHARRNQVLINPDIECFRIQVDRQAQVVPAIGGISH